MIPLRWKLHDPHLLIGLIEARDVSNGDASEELERILDVLLQTRPDSWPTPEVKTAVRDMLRRGGHKPSGRGKPASEYLAKVASRGDFPRISTLVDINNLVSLSTALPMSMLDRVRTLGDAQALEVRIGQDEERYVFNTAGQEIALRGLLGIGREGGVLVGNPVKDSMLGKTDAETTEALAVIYAPRQLYDETSLGHLCERYAGLLEDHAGASSTEWAVLSETSGS